MNNKECSICKISFTQLPQEIKKFEERDIPLPLTCPQCNFRHMLAFWVFGSFRKGTSDLSGKSFITNLPEKPRFPVYSRDEWNSDNWNQLAYGKDYNFSRPFFEQFKELQEATPHPHQFAFNVVNCDWCDDVFNCKDCYLCRSLLDSEQLSYSYRALRCKNSIDLTFTFDSELCYSLTYCFNCYKTFYSFDSRNCMDSAFLYDCRNCSNCFMCANLRNKQYCIFNEEHTKDEYAEKIKQYNLKSYSLLLKLEEQFTTLLQEEAYHRADHNTHAAQSTGNYLESCKACENCFFLQESENCTNTLRGLKCKDVSYSIGTLAEHAIYTSIDGYIYDTFATTHNSNCRYSQYLDFCDDCEYSFACVSLKKKKYCILNKQYQKDEFEKLKEKIISAMKKEGSWGRFFPLTLAPCGYNNSIAQAYFPETRESITTLNGIYDEIVIPESEGIKDSQIPDSITDIPDSFSSSALICPVTKKRFNIAPRELQFLKNHSISVPRHHPDYRTLKRFSKLTSLQNHEGSCLKCQQSITHYYPLEWGYKKILCTECYQKKVL